MTRLSQGFTMLRLRTLGVLELRSSTAREHTLHLREPHKVIRSRLGPNDPDASLAFPARGGPPKTALRRARTHMTENPVLSCRLTRGNGPDGRSEGQRRCEGRRRRAPKETMIVFRGRFARGAFPLRYAATTAPAIFLGGQIQGSP